MSAVRGFVPKRRGGSPCLKPMVMVHVPYRIVASPKKSDVGKTVWEWEDEGRRKKVKA